MAACGSLQRIFEKPLPESPTLLDSLSPWNQIKSMKPSQNSSFTEIFGELHFKEHSQPSSPIPFSPSSPPPSSSSSSFLIDLNPQALAEDPNKDRNGSPSSDYFSTTHSNRYAGSHRNSDSFSSMNSESLQLCTEGLGFESSDDVNDFKSDMDDDWRNREDKRSAVTATITKQTICCGEIRRSRISAGTFPPPISCIGISGKPGVCFQSYRHDGRFVLKEVRIPTQEFLHACREDGRLKLRFVQSDDEILEEEDEDEDEEEEEDEERDGEEGGGGNDGDGDGEKNGEREAKSDWNEQGMELETAQSHDGL